ncbi:F-box and associated interaction domains-containing protein [Striga asiatica]|uniref:F-box and associated interaction domains-containing protein n=1 Tax=Striga asiatica TaxID=4170 RepID=A0A5A7PVV3_STRAF|nr:F-box and associated interaction domains-containing protein [Striga asiatica]
MGKVADPQSEEFQSEPKSAANTLSPAGVVGGHSHTPRYYLRKRFRLASIESLPNDLLSDIIARLPPHDIRVPLGLVCRKWYHLTHHTPDLICRATSGGLLLHCLFLPKELIFISMRQGRVEKSICRYELGRFIWASCNGLLLGFVNGDPYSVRILNPATKQCFTLPPFSKIRYATLLPAMAYAAASMKYKVVVRNFVDGSNGVRNLECRILTVGVDTTWRHVYTKHLSLNRKQLSHDFKPLITDGFVHWVWDSSTSVFSLNVETEIISNSEVPLPRVHRNKRRFYLSTGRYLSLLVALGNFSWQVWQMKPETGEWLKVFSIDLEAENWRFDGFEDKVRQGVVLLIPVGWLNYPDVLVFAPPITNFNCILYKVCTREVHSVELPNTARRYLILNHNNCMASIPGG